MFHMYVTFTGFGNNIRLLLVPLRRARSFGDGRRKLRGARSRLPASIFGKCDRGLNFVGIPPA